MQIRVAFREEGDFWNAYIAKMANMDGAVLLGSIAMGVVTKNPERRQAFIDLMKDAFADAAQAVSGKRPEVFDERAAPESERAGDG